MGKENGKEIGGQALYRPQATEMARTIGRGHLMIKQVNSRWFSSYAFIFPIFPRFVTLTL